MRTRNGTIVVIVSLGILTAVFLCLVGAPLIWDGSYQLCRTLIDQQPFFYHTRFHSFPIWLPVVWLSKVTDDLPALVFAYGFPFCLAPVISILLSWWLVRRSAPWLIVWAVLGVYVMALPGQMFVVNDSIFQQHLFWPFYLGLLVPSTPGQRVVLAILAIFQLSHPVGALLLLGASMATGYLAWHDTAKRRPWLIRTGIVVALVIVASLKIVLWGDPYAKQEASLEMLRSRFHDGVAGWPAVAICCLWACAIFLWYNGRQAQDNWRQGRLAERYPSSWLSRGAMLCLFFAGVALIFWAADPQRWATAINYRRWAAPLALPVFAFAFLERAKPPSNADSSSDWQLRSRLMLGCAVIFALVLTLQGIAWHRMTDRLMTEIRHSPTAIVSVESLGGIRGTALDHWSIVSYALLSQGRQPGKLVLDKAGIAKLQLSPPQIMLASWDIRTIRAKRLDWFDYSAVMKELQEEGLTRK